MGRKTGKKVGSVCESCLKEVIFMEEVKETDGNVGRRVGGSRSIFL